MFLKGCTKPQYKMEMKQKSTLAQLGYLLYLNQGKSSTNIVSNLVIVHRLLYLNSKESPET